MRHRCDQVHSMSIEIAKVRGALQGLPTAGTNAQVTELTKHLLMLRLAAFLNVSESDVSLMCDNLERLKLFGASVDPESDYIAVAFVRSGRLSAFGAASIAACTR